MIDVLPLCNTTFVISEVSGLSMHITEQICLFCCINSQVVRSSPFLPRVASTLRQKMASFQSLMDVEENDACDSVPAQDSNTGGCIKTRDYLSGEAASLPQD